MDNLEVGDSTSDVITNVSTPAQVPGPADVALAVPESTYSRNVESKGQSGQNAGCNSNSLRSGLSRNQSTFVFEQDVAFYIREFTSSCLARI